MSTRPPRSTPFPYTTLFRSHRAAHHLREPLADGQAQSGAAVLARGRGVDLAERFEQTPDAIGGDADAGVAHRERSEEHTSELQSHVNLVCRLLLEKKK